MKIYDISPDISKTMCVDDDYADHEMFRDISYIATDLEVPGTRNFSEKSA